MIKSITSVKVKGRRVLLRAGFDVPLRKNIHTENWEVADDNRLVATLPTLKYLLTGGAKVIIISHLGRPEDWDTDKSLWPVAEKLGELLDMKVLKIGDKLPSYPVPHVNFLTGDITKKDFLELSKNLANGSILFLENLRFYPGEESNDLKFAKLLAGFGDVYVDDAFSVTHRKAASIVGITEKLSSYAGISLSKEIEALSKILRKPEKPMVVLMGGAKIKDKAETMENLAKNAAHILVGGGIGTTFLKALGYEIGKSIVGDVPTAKEILRNHKQKIILPVDVVVAKSENDLPRAVMIDKVRSSDIILDIGPETIRKFSTYIKNAKTLVWNGPMGKFENPHFAFGSLAIARMFGARASGPAFGVAGGGETAQLFNLAKVADFVDHISTGGGAMLELLAGKKLPGIKALDK
jgi:phosphoglycerate kinase